MPLRIRAAEAEDERAVSAFNRRLASAGSTWTFYESATPDWLAGGKNDLVWREHLLAVDDKDGVVRGGFVLKRQPFRVNGQEVVVGNVQGPVSEGIVSKRYAALGGIMLRDALAREPLQFGWGTSQQKLKLLQQLGWSVGVFPLMVKLIDVRATLRAEYLPLGRSASWARMLAETGLAQLAIKGWQAGLAVRAPSLRGVTVSAEREFGAWADRIWAVAASAYSMVAVRNAEALARLAPPAAWPFAFPILVKSRGGEVGWVVARITEAKNGLRIGSIVDALALPTFEALTLAAAAKHLQERGVHMIGAAFSHPAWIEASKRAGMISVSRRRSFAASPALVEAAGDAEIFRSGMHLTLIDGDGPRVF